ncbi:nuclear transport factor 2 family protein [Actinospica sp.]|jgi:hypothetical protein|uniref:nuclear transport factor 2 family protein n=1 Tax=Actinospica sp. TaxID=1872142 RepID=UPI002C92F936|nr:nuclear transport factor 2 family protein [Actinospica sp.]HWG24997.1 nuclear transport factor 2 family protein [Actinospica sp.]
MVTAAGSATDVAARLACADVVRASFQLIDDGHATQAARLYTVDGTLTLSDATKPAGDVTLRGPDIHGAMRDREAAARTTVHVLAPSAFRFTGPDRAESDCHLQLYVLGDDRSTSPGPRALSHVRDVLTRSADGAWRIAARRITILAGSR